MRNEFRNLRLKQLDRTLETFRAGAKIPRPQKGWLRAIREATGISASEVARTLKTSRQLPIQLEKAEAEYRLSDHFKSGQRLSLQNRPTGLAVRD